MKITAQNCYVARTYPKKCSITALCKPQNYFDKIEQCKICNKTL